MDKFITSANHLKADLDLIRNIHDNFSDGIIALSLITGNNTIIKGVEVEGSDLTDGWIVYDNELLPFKGGAIQSKFKVVSQIVLGRYRDQTEPLPVYEKRWAQPSSDPADIALSSLRRVKPLVDAQSIRVFGSVSTVNDPEQNQYDTAFLGDIINFERKEDLGCVYFLVTFPALAFDYIPLVVNNTSPLKDGHRGISITDIQSSSFKLWPRDLTSADQYEAAFLIQISK